MSGAAPSQNGKWTTVYVFTQATVCLLLGLLCGYLLRGAAPASATDAKPRVPVAQPAPNTPPTHVTAEQLRHMGDTEAAPLLAQLQKSPNDPTLLAKLGYVYYATHNFKQAAEYYERSVNVHDDVAIRTELGRAYFYAGDADRALAEFQHIIEADPGNANALYNVGMIRWKQKGDTKGAIAAWQQLLKTNPDHPRRADVEQLIATARQHK